MRKAVTLIVANPDFEREILVHKEIREFNFLKMEGLAARREIDPICYLTSITMHPSIK